MKIYKFSISNDIAKNAQKVRENLQEVGQMQYAYNMALQNHPGCYIHEIKYSFDPEQEEGGTHQWIIELKDIKDIVK